MWIKQLKASMTDATAACCIVVHTVVVATDYDVTAMIACTDW